MIQTNLQCFNEKVLRLKTSDQNWFLNGRSWCQYWAGCLIAVCFGVFFAFDINILIKLLNIVCFLKSMDSALYLN